MCSFKYFSSVFYTTYISVDLAHHEIFRAKVGMGGINGSSSWTKVDLQRVIVVFPGHTRLFMRV